MQNEDKKSGFPSFLLKNPHKWCGRQESAETPQAEPSRQAKSDHIRILPRNYLHYKLSSLLNLPIRFRNAVL